MGGKSLKVENFTRRNSFSLWQIKVRALLKREGFWTPLLKPAPNPEPENMAHSMLLLSLEDDIIAEVSEQDIVAELWCKLENLYMTKSLTNKLILKQRLFGLRM
ncbi:hypothetical protein LIER_16563 [Lithospermum erythrorhizon]|uniref:Retrovirus-related Pol polyprotein from transposon TNT 1-94 n=1 Tax=Lithospermum erythrorhizon TaxID=34254 RepID=A0AAV3Q9M6_LITER